jgi:hypothetical protein
MRRRTREQDLTRPCGCKSGAALSIAALVGWPAWQLASGPPHTPLGIALAFIAYPLVVVGAGVLGKLGGILVGRERHRRLRRQLARRPAVRIPTAEG